MIMLVDPPGEQKGINVGLAYLSGALGEKDIEHLVVDMVNGDIGIKELLDIVAEKKPAFFGISIKTATYTSSVKVAENLKKSFPEIPIIAGGPHATLYGEELLNEVPCIDMVLGYDSELSLPALLSNWDGKSEIPEIPGAKFRTSEGIRSVSPEIPADLDALAFPDFDRFVGLDTTLHHYPLVTSRGCPHGCIYCSVGKVSGRKWRRRSPSNVVDELERARDKWGFFEFDVLDDTFTNKIEHASEICRVIIERELGMKWSCPNGIRADHTTGELLENMAAAGCHTVIFGVESGDPEVFASLRKGEKLADVENAVRMAQAAGLRVGGYFIIGLPGDTYEGTMSSLDYADRIGLDWAHFNILAPYPGTRVWEIIEEKGRFLDDWRTTRHFGTEPRPIFELDAYDAQDMVRAYRTVHIRQKLYHLLLPSDLDEKNRNAAIRKLRIKYDRRAWISDVIRDVGKAPEMVATLAMAAGHEIKLKIPRKTPVGPRQAQTATPDKLRVLMVNDHGGAVGGTERYIRDISIELQSRGMETAWCYERSGDWDGIDFPRYKVRGLWDTDTDKKDIEKDLTAAIRDFRPDIIHIHNIHSPAVMKICSEFAPSVRTVHDHNFTCPSMNRMWATGGICDRPAGMACIDKLPDGGCMVLGRRPLTMLPRLKTVLNGLRASKRLSKILVASRFMGDELANNGVARDRVRVIPLYVDFPDDVEPAGEDGPVRILWAGRMVVPDKGPDIFLDVISRVGGDFKAVMAGAGPAEDFVRRKASDLELTDRVEFIGNVDSKRMDEEYGRCHMVAFTSVWPEPFGYVGVEAAGYARPVVAFDVGAVGEWLVDGEGGHIVTRGHSGAMALWINRLMKDAALRRGMGRKNREHAAAIFTRENHLEELMSVYGEVVGK